MSKNMRTFIMAGLLFSSITLADTTTRISATIVASSCHGIIRSETEDGITDYITFDTIGLKQSISRVKKFSLILTEHQGEERGCSLFDLYPHPYTLSGLLFGDTTNEQLDDQGVTTRYKDGRPSPVRVRISPINTEAHFGYETNVTFLTRKNNFLLYPASSFKLGEFNFYADLTNISSAKAEDIWGNLTLTLVYY